MKQKHIEAELNFYGSAFCKDPDLTKINFNWQYQPGIGMIKLFDLYLKDAFHEESKMLDIGIGNGRHVEYFRKNSFSVTGIDFCKKALDICRNRFWDDNNVQLIKTDFTKKEAAKKIGQFDLVLDWSVIDHIRRQYLKSYIANIVDSIKHDGYLIVAAFDISLPGLWKGKDYKVVNGHYSRGFTVDDLKNLFSSLKMIASMGPIIEDLINNYSFNTILFKKEEK
jgi:2-polyprenyl-3-methyl-5-hydroxy-6-metoxy-1,4-benzoquinol methylase